MSNSNYNLNLKAKATSGGNEVEFDFDPYNDCTDMDELKTLATEKLNEEISNVEDDDTIEEDDVDVKIIDFDEVPDKWANEDDVWDFAAAFAECDQDIEVVEAALECGIEARNIDEAYSGSFKSDEDFAEDMAEQVGAIDRDAKWPMTCIDWDQAARELMMDYSEHNGYYFRNF